MPAFSLMRKVIADDYVNGENIQADKYQSVTIFNGFTDASGADAWKWNDLNLTGMYGIANIGGWDEFNPQQYRMLVIDENWGMLDLMSSTTKFL